MPAVLLAVIMALGVILNFGGAIGSQVAQLATNIPQYAVTIENKVDTVRSYTVGRIASFVDSLGHQDAPLGNSQIPSGARPSTGRPVGISPQAAPAGTTESVASPLSVIGIRISRAR